MKSTVTLEDLNALSDSLVDPCQVFAKEKWRKHIDVDQVADTLRQHGILADTSAGSNPDAIPITNQLRTLMEERAGIYLDHESHRLSREARDTVLAKVNSKIARHVAASLGAADFVNIKTADGQTPFKARPHQPFDDLAQEHKKNVEALKVYEKNRKANLAAEPVTAPDILYIAREHIRQRGEVRDCDDGERSMAATVAAFNAIYGHTLTETEGWQLMVLLKMVRGCQGAFHRDDYQDQTAYSALAGEAAGKESNNA